MKVICTPTKDLVNAGFTYDLVNLISNSKDVVFSISQGSILSNLRELLVRTSINAGASHILFIDSDMRFPAYTLDRLVSHDVDIVGCNCKQRTQDEFTARKDGKFVNSKDKTGIEEVDTIGFGVTLLKTSIFNNMPEPWFSMPWDGNKHVGEDVFFCNLVKEHGYKVMVDHDLSKDIRHSGVVEFGI